MMHWWRYERYSYIFKIHCYRFKIRKITQLTCRKDVKRDGQPINKVNDGYPKQSNLAKSSKVIIILIKYAGS